MINKCYFEIPVLVWMSRMTYETRNAGPMTRPASRSRLKAEATMSSHKEVKRGLVLCAYKRTRSHKKTCCTLLGSIGEPSCPCKHTLVSYEARWQQAAEAKPFNPIGWACERVRADGGEGVLPTAAFGLCVPPCGPLHQRSPCSEGRCLQLASGREGCPFHKHEARDRQAPDWDHVTGRAFLVGTKDSSLLVSLNMCPESLSSASNCNCNPESKSYIAAAFVKWVEAAGGRPVPIRFYNSEAELYRLFKQLNGLVFPVSTRINWFAGRIGQTVMIMNTIVCE
eukprot:1160992-Pelagomonas_calceolata.AAC.6